MHKGLSKFENCSTPVGAQWPAKATGGRSSSARCVNVPLAAELSSPITRAQWSTGETERQTDARCAYLPKAISHGILKL